jgi:hypothetical protein
MDRLRLSFTERMVHDHAHEIRMKNGMDISTGGCMFQGSIDVLMAMMKVHIWVNQ